VERTIAQVGLGAVAPNRVYLISTLKLLHERLEMRCITTDNDTESQLGQALLSAFATSLLFRCSCQSESDAHGGVVISRFLNPRQRPCQLI
jgi:hypothetical protein